MLLRINEEIDLLCNYKNPTLLVTYTSPVDEKPTAQVRIHLGAVGEEERKYIVRWRQNQLQTTPGPYLYLHNYR